MKMLNWKKRNQEEELTIDEELGWTSRPKTSKKEMNEIIQAAKKLGLLDKDN